MVKIHIPLAIMVPAMALVAVSCSESNEEPAPDSVTGKEIRFAASTEYSRAGDITATNLTTFNVYAYTGTGDAYQPFMDNVTVTKSSANVWTYSPVKYWPAKQTVDFYAFAPASWVGTSGPLMPVPYDASAGTEDIVYAVCPDMSGNAGQPNAQVVFNFRHALSKLTVKLSSSDTKFKVVVSNVGMSNILTKGNFSFPSASTALDPSAESVGSWSDQNTPISYVLYWSQSMSDLLTLSTTPTVLITPGPGRGGVLYVLPQKLTWRSNGSGNDTYLAVMCSVYDAENGTKLWPNENTPEENRVDGSTTGDGILKFPLSNSLYTEWHPGCHYIYSLVINSNEDMGTIEFGTPSVDTFISIETTYE